MIVEEEETIQPARRGDTVLHCCVDFSYDCYWLPLLPLADADVDCRHDFKVLSQLLVGALTQFFLIAVSSLHEFAGSCHWTMPLGIFT